jgi:hypothetical protein
MAALGSAVDSLGPFVDGDAILDGILRRSRPAWPAAFETTRDITPQLLGPLGCPIDEGVDRLATHGPQTTFVSSLQPAGNLLRGPPVHQFTEVGLLRQIAIDCSKSYFDTNNTEHQHYYIEDRHEVIDIPPTTVVLGKAPEPPEGYEIVRIDVVVRLRRKTINSAPTS